MVTNRQLKAVTRKSEVDRQREHQANERTFLAWLRTSIALIGFGFAIARFGLFLHQLQATVTQQAAPTNSLLSSENLGVSLVIVGIVVDDTDVAAYQQKCSHLLAKRIFSSPHLLFVHVGELFPELSELRQVIYHHVGIIRIVVNELLMVFLSCIKTV